MIRHSLGEAAAAVDVLERAISSRPVADLPALAGELERLQAAAWTRIMTPEAPTPAVAAKSATEDRYLTMQEVQARTGLSSSYLYELARAGSLPVKRMGRGTDGRRPRGYRVLLSDLLAWEQENAGSDGLSDMLSSRPDRRGVPTASTAARVDAGGAGRQDGRPPDHTVPLGARRQRRPRTRRQADPVAGADPAA